MTVAMDKRGFSLIELMIAMGITAGMAAVVFNLFLQNQNVFRDQNLTIEMRQSVRAVASMMADEIRMAGQGVPTYAASMDTASSPEDIQSFLNGTDGSTIVFRSGIRNGAATVTSFPPLTYTANAQTRVTVDDVDAISAIVGSDTDRFLYLWGETDSSFTWVRAQIDGINTGTDVITLTPDTIALGGGTFPTVPNIVVEEAIAYRLNSGNIQRGTSGDFTTVTAPVMSYATVGANFTGLSFTYYDGSGNVVMGTALADRATVRRVDFTLAARTSDLMPSFNAYGTFEITMTVYPRNVQLY